MGSKSSCDGASQHQQEVGLEGATTQGSGLWGGRGKGPMCNWGGPSQLSPNSSSTEDHSGWVGLGRQSSESQASLGCTGRSCLQQTKTPTELGAVVVAHICDPSPGYQGRKMANSSRSQGDNISKPKPEESMQDGSERICNMTSTPEPLKSGEREMTSQSHLQSFLRTC